MQLLRIAIITLLFSSCLAADFSLFEAYIKASNTGSGDSFGSISLSGDGNTLAVGAHGEGSAAVGVNGNQNDDLAIKSGAVYVFVRVGSAWAQQAYIKSSHTRAYDSFGWVIDLSADGNTLAIGAHNDWSNSTGINNAQATTSANSSGAVYVFERDDNANWSQQAYIKASNANAEDKFGHSVSLSTDGNSLSVGAYKEASGIAMNKFDNSRTLSGAAYFFIRSATGVWSEQAYVKSTDLNVISQFGISIALSASGNYMVVGADRNDGDAGAAYVFAQNAGVWQQVAKLTARNGNRSDYFGVSVAVGGDGDIVAVGAPYEDSNATGINGDETNEDATQAGAVYVFLRNGQQWQQEAYVKPSIVAPGALFGWSVALSRDGNILAVGERGSSLGVVYVYERIAGLWSPKNSLVAPNAGVNIEFGFGVALSGDGSTVSIGAPEEKSNARGVNSTGEWDDVSSPNSGAVYIYRDSLFVAISPTINFCPPLSTCSCSGSGSSRKCTVNTNYIAPPAAQVAVPSGSTLTFNLNVTFNSDSTTTVFLPSSTAPLVVQGTATIGGNLVIQTSPTTTASISVLVLTAAGGIVGNYSAVSIVSDNSCIAAEAQSPVVIGSTLQVIIDFTNECGGLSTGAIIGIAVGCVLVGVFAILLLIYLLKRAVLRRTNKMNQEIKNRDIKNIELEALKVTAN